MTAKQHAEAAGIPARLYLIAHAPEQPQEWFLPEMPPAPEAPKFHREETDEECEDRRAVYEGWLSAEQVRSPRLAEYLRLRDEHASAMLKWSEERRKQMRIQWPAAWADAMLEQMGKESEAKTETPGATPFGSLIVRRIEFSFPESLNDQLPFSGRGSADLLASCTNLLRAGLASVGVNQSPNDRVMFMHDPNERTPRLVWSRGLS